MIIDHIGVAVKSIEQSLVFWKNTFGYEQKTELVINTCQKVMVVFLKKENSIDVKLIEPTDETSPIYTFTQKGGGIHHVCFKCDSIEHGIERLKGSGMRVLAQPQPGEAFENENIAFLFGKGKKRGKEERKEEGKKRGQVSTIDKMMSL